MGMAANKGLPSWIIERLEIGGFLENTNRRPQKTLACVNRLSGKKIVTKGKGTGRGGGNLGGNRPFRFSLSLVPRSTKGLFTERIPRNLLLACRLCLFVAFLNYFIANERCMFTTRRKFTLNKINANFPKVGFTLACAQTKLNSG